MNSQTKEGSVAVGGRDKRASSSSSWYVLYVPFKTMYRVRVLFKKKKTKGPNPNICLVVDIGMRGRAHTHGEHPRSRRSQRGGGGGGGGGRATLYVFFSSSSSSSSRRRQTFSLLAVCFFFFQGFSFVSRENHQHVHRRHTYRTLERKENCENPQNSESNQSKCRTALLNMKLPPHGNKEEKPFFFFFFFQISQSVAIHRLQIHPHCNT